MPELVDEELDDVDEEDEELVEVPSAGSPPPQADSMPAETSNNKIREETMLCIPLGVSKTFAHKLHCSARSWRVMD